MEGVFALLKTGGLAMYPLLLLSVISWAVAIERLINLRSSNFLSKNLKEAKSLLRSGDLEGAIKLLSLDTSLGSKAILKVLEDFKSGKVPKTGLTEALRTEIDLLVPKVEKNLALLSNTS